MYGGGIQRGGPPRGQINPNQGNSNNANMNQQQFMAGVRIHLLFCRLFEFLFLLFSFFIRNSDAWQFS